MKKVDFIWHLAAIIFAVCFINACEKNERSQPPDPPSATDLIDYKSYSNDGLKLRYPSHWALEYDDSPDLFADRGVSFRVSETSHADVLIFDERDVDLADIAGHIETRLSLTSSDHIRDYQRIPLQLGNHKGILLRWRNTLLIEYTVELSIFQVEVSPKRVFTLFNFDERTPTEDMAYRVPFNTSIKIQ